MSYVLGVDGGNTKTIALVARTDGAIIGVGRGGCGDIYGASSPQAALAQIELAVQTALQAAQVLPNELANGTFSLAGADWPEDFDLLYAAMQERGLGRSVMVVNDALGALRAGSPDGTGVSVVCGSGTAIGARAADGRFWHSSFWQEPQGAGELSDRALRAIYRAALEIDPPTRLAEGVLAFFGAESVEEVLHRLTAREHRKLTDRRLLARVVLDTAEAGDPTARRIVITHGRSLGDYALVAARKTGLGAGGAPFTLVLAGGVLRHQSALLRDTLIAQVRASAPGVRPIHSRLEPAVGALLLALEAAGSMIDAALLAELERTLPPHSFFAT